MIALHFSNNQEPTVAKPTLEPAAPYENLHHVARDYLDRLRQSLDALQKPDNPALRWRNVHMLAQVNARLAEAGELLDQITAHSI